MNNEPISENMLYLALIRWISLIIIVITISVVTYNVIDRIGPVKPYIHQQYSWPDGAPSK